jgi:mannose-6-phosphate isomerase-like protein (cupin superfamily)
MALVKNFDTPDETRSIERGSLAVVKLGPVTVMRARFEPGWRWSDCVKPVAGTASCEVAHLLYVTSGRMGVRMDDGSEFECGSGDIVSIEPGHDAWIIGDEVFEAIDVQGGGSYAKRT